LGVELLPSQITHPLGIADTAPDHITITPEGIMSLTKAVVAIDVSLSPIAGVGAVGLPVNAGLARGAAPKFVLAEAAFEAPVPPSATARSVIPDMEPPVMLTSVTISAVVFATMTIAPPLKLIAASAFELSVTDLVSVVPLAV
jgi:hypothetical protein